MDDDTKQYTIQVKGTAYKFKPLDLEAVNRLQVISLMDASPGVMTKGMLRLIKLSMGDEQWDDLATRVMTGEVELQKELNPLADKLVKRTVKDLKERQEAAESSNDDE